LRAGAAIYAACDKVFRFDDLNEKKLLSGDDASLYARMNEVNRQFA
jgi:hypothetical protein